MALTLKDIMEVTERQRRQREFDNMMPRSYASLVNQCFSKPGFRALIFVPDQQRVDLVLARFNRLIHRNNVTSMRVNMLDPAVMFRNGSGIIIAAPPVERLLSMEFDASVNETDLSVMHRMRPRPDSYFHDQAMTLKRRRFAEMYGAGPNTLARMTEMPRPCSNYLAQGEAADAMVERLNLSTPKEEPVAKKDKITKDAIKANKFYVGSSSVFDERHDAASGWGHASLPAATEHATRLLEQSDGETQFIVKIVRVVRRKKPPVVVENVK